MLIQTNYIKSNRPEMLRFITNNPKTSLEVGCREATHSKLLKETLGIEETWGIEPEKNETMIAEAEENLDHFISDYLTENTKGLPANYFDLIVFNDVLEHMYDPWEVLIQTKKLLSDDGNIVISIPNMRHKSVLKELLFNDNFEYREEGLLDVTHIRFFTEKTLRKMLHECGYEIIKIDSLSTDRIKLRKRFFNFITNNKFKTLNTFQFGITAKKIN